MIAEPPTEVVTPDTTPTSFRVPLARAADGRLVRPAEATPRTPYTCAVCGCRVIRRARTRRPHFAHMTDATRPCSSETVLHQLAKELICDAVRAWKAGAAPAPVIEHPCATSYCKEVVRSPMRDVVADAELEQRVDDRWVVDVLLRRADGRPSGAVEIVVSHEMDDEKVAAITIPWIEVDAEQIVAVSTTWRVRRTSKGPQKCARCVDRDERCATSDRTAADLQGTAARWAWHIADLERWNVRALFRKYEASVHICFRCGGSMPVFRWSHELRRPPWPRPPTLRWASGSKVRGFANHCIHCDTAQHDYYVESAFELRPLEEMLQDPHFSEKRRARLKLFFERLAAARTRIPPALPPWT